MHFGSGVACGDATRGQILRPLVQPVPPARGASREDSLRSLRRSLGQAATIGATVEVAESIWPPSSSRGQVPACGSLR